MKKITLAIIALATCASSAFSQVTTTVTAPPSSNASTQVRAPNGNATHKFVRGCFIVPQSDCQGFLMTNSVVTNWGLRLLQGTSAQAVTGSFTLYIQNTADATYLKGTNFPAAIVGMPVAYVGNMTVPVAAGAATITLPLIPNFTYAGQGIYVAYAWDSNGPFDANYATYDANHLMTIGGATADASVTPAPTTLTNTNFRPVFLWTCANTATNELALENVVAPGKVAKLFNSPHIITATVRNLSNVALNSVSVGLAVTGANTMANSQVISSIPAGGTQTVGFTPFNPLNLGLNNMVVSLLPDQNPANNSASWTQSVTCDVQAQNPSAGSYTSGVGTTATGCIVNRFTVPVGATLTAVRLAIASGASSTGSTIAAVLLDGAGALIGYSSNTITISGSMLNTFQTFNFSPGLILSSGTNFHVGFAQLQGGHFPMGFTPGTSFIPSGYYYCPLAGGTLQGLGYGYFGIEPVFQFDNMVITASATKTVVCKGSPQNVTLSVTGADTYVWSAGLGTGSTVTITPSANGASTATQVSVIGSYTTGAASGCKSNQSAITFTLLACSGLANNSANDAVKLYPNPTASGKTNVTGLVGENTILVYNTLGQVVHSQITTNETATIDISAYPAGNYLVKITDSSRESRIIKIVNQN
ncbi:MAG: T9SS type A sorting domain-containing protein [bacterium]|nr:T9SS type A sorting domain-containing protein [bacterium]